MPESEPITEQDQAVLDRLAGLVHEEQAGQRITLLVGPFSAFTLIGFLDLCLRHPELGEKIEGIGTAIRDQLAEAFRGEPVLWDTLQRGKDPANDLPGVVV